MKKSIFIASLLAGSSIAAGAMAQSSEVIGLEEVVVTAQRVEESAQRAALAISVVQPEALVNVTNTLDLGRAVPALQLSNAGGSSPILYLRGVGTFAANPYTDSAVAVNYDGIYLGRPTSATGLYYDLDRIEVLKGPQGTLYGRNATGGALNVIPARPRLGVGSFEGIASVGNFDSYTIQTATNIPLTETTALRFSAFTNYHEGYNTDGTGSEEGTGGRLQLLWEPTDKVSLRLSGDYSELGGTGPTAVVKALSTPTGYRPSGLDQDVGLFDPRTTAILNSPAALAFPAGAPYGGSAARPYINNSYWGLAAELNWDLGFGQLTVLPAWRKSNLDTVSFVAFNVGSFETDEQFSGEIRLAGETGKLQWLGGLYYFNEETDAEFRIGGNVFLGEQSLQAENKSYAAFGRLVWNFTDTFRLSGAARYTKDDKSMDGYALTNLAICTSPSHLCFGIRRPIGGLNQTNAAALASIGYIQPPGSPVYVDVAGNSQVIWAGSPIVVNKSTETEEVTYRVAAEYEPRGGSLLYASFETGYRSGGFSFSSVAPIYEPETIDAFTLGAKNRFFDNRVQLNVEAFYWKYKDQQVSHSTVGVTGGQEFVTENIGESTNQGIEVEAVARPFENTTLNATVQYLDAKNDDFVFTEANAGSPPAINCPTTLNPGGGTYRIDCSGQRALRSPEWTMNFGAQQTLNVSEGYKVVLEGSTRYQSKSIMMFERVPDFGEVDAYWNSAASISFGPRDDRWALSAFVNNIEDKRVGLNPFLEPFSHFIADIYSAPRTYGVRFRAHLGG